MLLDKLGLADVESKAQYDRAAWPALKARLRALFLSQPSAHWRALLEGCDACFAPVLSLVEAAAHPHMKARGVYKNGADGALEAAGGAALLAARMRRAPAWVEKERKLNDAE